MEPENVEIQALAQRILSKAARKLGGFAALSKYLGVGEETLGDWVVGRFVPPAEVILKTVSLLVDEPAAFWREPSAEQPAAPVVRFAAGKRFGTD